MNKRILVVDDDPTMCHMLQQHLERRGFLVNSVGTAEAALQSIATNDFETVVSDLQLRGPNGLDLCARIVKERPDVPVLVITAFGSLDTAIGAIRAGAYDFVPKPFEIDTLVVALERAVQHHRLQREVHRLRKVVGDARRTGSLRGDSEPMQRIGALIEQFKDSDATVLLTGESGTGKELVARALHARSRRAQGPFVAINCAAMPEQLLESELFGHVRGAFTDARQARQGLFTQADSGTLFLDEIGELPVGLQAKLLRALQERVVRPLGADAEVPFDARVVTATNRNLEQAVKERSFREDLYYRINVLAIELPPLRHRGTDILLLAQHFVEHFAAASGRRVTGLTPSTAEKLLAYEWPGNVRELQNCVERAVAVTQYGELVLADFPERIRNHQALPASGLPPESSEALLPMEEVERRYVQHVLAQVGGNKALAARILGFDRTTLYRKLERYDGTRG